MKFTLTILFVAICALDGELQISKSTESSLYEFVISHNICDEIVCNGKIAEAEFRKIHANHYFLSGLENGYILYTYYDNKYYLFNSEEDLFSRETSDSTFYILTSRIFNDAIKETNTVDLIDLISDFFPYHNMHQIQNASVVANYYEERKEPLSTIINDKSYEYDLKLISSIFKGQQLVVFIDTCSILDPFLILIEHEKIF